MNQNFMVFGAMMLALMVTLCGCPQPHQENVVETNPEVVPANSGRLLFEGNIWNDADKNGGFWGELSQAMQSEIGLLQFDFYEVDEYGYHWYSHLQVLIEDDGSFQAVSNWMPLSINTITGFATGSQGDLFRAEIGIELVAGETTSVVVPFDFVETFPYKFTVVGLPGEYDQWSIPRTVVDETEYYTYHTITADDEIIFTGYLPLDLRDKEVYLAIVDLNGDPYAAALDGQLDIFTALSGEVQYIEYTTPDNVGSVEFTLTFPDEETMR